MCIERKYYTQTRPENDLANLFGSHEHKDEHTQVSKKVRAFVWGHQASLVNILTGKGRVMQSVLLRKDAKEHGFLSVFREPPLL